MAVNPTRQLTYKTNSAKANKEKSSVSGGGGCGDSRKVTAPGRPASRFWQRERRSGVRGCPQGKRHGRVRELPQNARPPAGPALQHPKTNGAEAPGNAAAFRASAPEENKEHTKRDKENHMSRAVLQPTRRPAVAEPPRPPAGTEKRGAGPPRPGRASNQPAAGRWRNRPGRPAGTEKRAPTRPDRAVLQPTRRPAVAEPPRPPAGTEKRGPARRS